ncbi:hypothetical protein Bca4012_056954 [Brassica carinata]|uniref:Uncharacterized protein n=1 Tax=Brassica carinata TaxID=52824 RepID=A0A8X7W389_BRACI|nr:hypothetical protein Bca52824_015469 [Brassica carinata]
MESSRFSSKRPLTVNELYAEWSKNLTNYCLPLLGESIRSDPSAVVPDTDVDNVIYYLIKHYETLSTSSDKDTIRNILFPSGNETQLFFIGDIHPCLFTCLIRSLIDPTWKDEEVRRIDEIERRMMLSVSDLMEQMSKAQFHFIARVSKNWVAATEASSSAVDEAAKEEKEELVRIFAAANSLRKSVLKEIFKATTGIQAALFLESLCQFLAGFKEDQYSPQQHTPEPSLSHYLENNNNNMEEEQQHTSEPDESQNRTLWIGNVGDRTETEYIYRCFAETGEVVSIHFPTYRVAGVNRIGYGFIEFISPDAAERALQKYNNTFIPELVPPRRFILKWAMMTKKKTRASVFISDLADDVTDDMLLKTFTDHGYSSAISAMVSTDAATGRSRGCGCVRFSDQGQMLLAVERMNGVECSNRPMRIAPRRRNKNYLCL